jgi:hypothetical protein
MARAADGQEADRRLVAIACDEISCWSSTRYGWPSRDDRPAGAWCITPIVDRSTSLWRPAATASSSVHGPALLEFETGCSWPRTRGDDISGATAAVRPSPRNTTSAAGRIPRGRADRDEGARARAHAVRRPIRGRVSPGAGGRARPCRHQRLTTTARCRCAASPLRCPTPHDTEACESAATKSCCSRTGCYPATTRRQFLDRAAPCPPPPPIGRVRRRPAGGGSEPIDE